MTTFDVVLVPFPFADLSTSKRRPALVLATLEPKGLQRHLVVCMVTSQLEGVAFPFDYRLSEHGKAGLPKPSLVRVGKVVTLEAGMVLKRLGTLGTRDRKAVGVQVKALFARAGLRSV